MDWHHAALRAYIEGTMDYVKAGDAATAAATILD